MSDLRTPLPTTKRMRRCLRLWAIEIGAPSRICTRTECVLSALPLLLGYRSFWNWWAWRELHPQGSSILSRAVLLFPVIHKPIWNWYPESDSNRHSSVFETAAVTSYATGAFWIRQWQQDSNLRCWLKTHMLMPVCCQCIPLSLLIRLSQFFCWFDLSGTSPAQCWFLSLCVWYLLQLTQRTSSNPWWLSHALSTLYHYKLGRCFL